MKEVICNCLVDEDCIRVCPHAIPHRANKVMGNCDKRKVRCVLRDKMSICKPVKKVKV